MTIEKLNEMIEVKKAELEGLELLAEKAKYTDMVGEKAEKAAAKKEAQEKKGQKKPATKGKTVKKEDKEEATGYEAMTAQNLYKECCSRGISSKCKERNKAYLIKVLEADDAEKENADGDDWGDEETGSPYEGKKPSELYKMCVDRGINTKKQLKADVYIKLLEKADEEAAEDDADEWDDDSDDDDSDEWEL